MAIKKVVLLLVCFMLLFAVIGLNAWSIEYDISSVKDINVEFSEPLVEPQPVAYLKGKYFCQDGLKLDVEVEMDDSIEVGKVGRYPIKYTVSFLFLRKEINGYYNIVDFESPTISFDFKHDEYILPGEDYNKFTAIDNYDGDVTDKVIVGVGADSVKYSVKDSFGNETVIVKKLVTDETKVIYLTFDDGPSKYTAELLDILKKHNVKATFFVIGSSYSDIFARMVEEGHALGIHTYTHEFKDIYKSEENYFADLNKISDLIYEKTGYRTNLLRFPGGGSNTVSRKYNKGIMTRLSSLVEEQGFAYFDWNVDSGDAGGTTETEKVFENVKSGIGSKKKAIVLQHDTKKYSIDAVESIIVWGKENGYVFLPLNEFSFTAHHNILN